MNKNKAQILVMWAKLNNKKRKEASVRPSRTRWLLPQCNSMSIKWVGSSSERSRSVEFRSPRQNHQLKTMDSLTISPQNNSRPHLAVLRNRPKSKYRKTLPISKARSCCGSSKTRIWALRCKHWIICSRSCQSPPGNAWSNFTGLSHLNRKRTNWSWTNRKKRCLKWNSISERLRSRQTRSLAMQDRRTLWVKTWMTRS